MTKKGPDAFRTISEVAGILNVPQHILRFWETRFSQIKPVKRAGGRRYYRPNDINFLKKIKHLLYEDGYSIRGIQKLLKRNEIAIFSSYEKEIPKEYDKILLKKKDSYNDTFIKENIACLKRNFDDNHENSLFTFLKASDLQKKEKQTIHLSKDEITLLQGVLFELIQCKRLLDWTLLN